MRGTTHWNYQTQFPPYNTSYVTVRRVSITQLRLIHGIITEKHRTVTVSMCTPISKCCYCQGGWRRSQTLAAHFIAVLNILVMSTTVVKVFYGGTREGPLRPH